MKLASQQHTETCEISVPETHRQRHNQQTETENNCPNLAHLSSQAPNPQNLEISSPHYRVKDCSQHSLRREIRLPMIVVKRNTAINNRCERNTVVDDHCKRNTAATGKDARCHEQKERQFPVLQTHSDNSPKRWQNTTRAPSHSFLQGRKRRVQPAVGKRIRYVS